MNKYIFTFSLFAFGLALSSTTTYAQLPTPAVVNTIGLTVVSSNHQVDMSIGEPIIETITTTSNILTQGLLQPSYKIATGVVPSNPAGVANIFPNPFTSGFSIETSVQYNSVVLFDMAGKQVYYATASSIYQAPKLAAGLYNAVLLNINGGTMARFKIVKITE